MSDPAQREPFETSYLVRYTFLTLAFFLPLTWAFITLKNVYPIASWTVMTGGDLRRSHRYFILRGETAAGELIEIRPITLTDGLSARHWGLVNATVDNKSFELSSPHPENAALMATAGNLTRLPRAARLPELLRAWGEIYNSRLPVSSPQRLKAIRLDSYRWMGQQYSDYDRFIESWREEP